MKIYSFMIAGALLAMMLFAGCASSEEYRIPLPTVDIKANPSVKITTVGSSPMLHELAFKIGCEFKKNGGRVVEGQSDYWLVIYGVQQKRFDTAVDNSYNIVYGKASRSIPGGTEEVITASKFSTAVDSHFASVTLYEVKTMTPLVNMDFPFYMDSRVAGSRPPVMDKSNAITRAFINTMNEILVFKKSQ